MEHKKNIICRVSFSYLREENNNAKSAGERLYGLTSSIADNRTGLVCRVFSVHPWEFGQRGAAASQALLQWVFTSLTFTETPATSAGHLTEMRSDTFFLFLYLENDNSYCCIYKERHFVFFLSWRKMS